MKIKYPDLSNAETVDCKTDAGITVGLIAALLSISAVLVKRDLAEPSVIAALLDLRDDSDLEYIIRYACNLAIYNQIPDGDKAAAGE